MLITPRARHQRPGLRAARHRQDPRPVRPGPPPGGSRPIRPLRSGLPPGAGTPWYRNCSPPSATWTCPASCASWTTSTSCSSTTWATCPKAPRSPRSSSPSSPNATSADRWASRQTWSSRSGSASSPTPWPPPRRLTGSCTTPSSWSLTSPATGPTLPSNGARPRR